MTETKTTSATNVMPRTPAKKERKPAATVTIKASEARQIVRALNAHAKHLANIHDTDAARGAAVLAFSIMLALDYDKVVVK